MLRAVANIPLYIGSYTYATLPSASTYSGYEAFASDWGANGTKVRSNGTRWLPIGGQVVLKRAGTAVSLIANVETIVTQVQMPVGALQTGDLILIHDSVSKTGTTDSAQISVRMGTAGTTADTAITGLSSYAQLAAASVSGGGIYSIRVLSATSAQKLGNNAGGTSAYGGSGASAIAAATAGLADMTANAVWITLTIKSSGTTDTVGWQEASIIHEVG